MKNLEIIYHKNHWQIIDLNTGRDLVQDNIITEFKLTHDKFFRPQVTLTLNPDTIKVTGSMPVKCKRVKLK